MLRPYVNKPWLLGDAAPLHRIEEVIHFTQGNRGE